MSDIEKIKELRQQTGLPFGEIKKALDKAKGDVSKTVEILKEQGASVAAKKANRELGAGVVDTYIHTTKKVGSMIELFCETDFVAKNKEFQELAREISMQVASMNPQDEKDLLAQTYIRDQDMTVQELIQQYIAKLGENVKVGKFVRFEI